MESIKTEFTKTQTACKSDNDTVKSACENLKASVLKMEHVVRDNIQYCKTLIVNNGENLQNIQDNVLSVSFALAHLKSSLEASGYMQEDSAVDEETD